MIGPVGTHGAGDVVHATTLGAWNDTPHQAFGADCCSHSHRAVLGTTVGNAVGVTTLAAAVNTLASTPAEARRRRGGRHRRGRGRRGRHRRGRGRGRGRGVCFGVGGAWICT